MLLQMGANTMIFEATFAGESDAGNNILRDVQAENGMHRHHIWLDARYRGHFSQPMKGLRVQISGRYRRYRDGPDGWTIEKIRSVEVIL
jgi:hypothetical protein